MFKDFEKKPTLDQFIQDVGAEEASTRRVSVGAYDLELYPTGVLAIRGKVLNDELAVSPQGLTDLARLTYIPPDYFLDCDPELQSTSFNRRCRQKIAAGRLLQVTTKDKTVVKVQNGNLLAAPRLPILHSISNSIPDTVEKGSVRVIKHAWNGHFDISVISPAMTCQPRRGDIVAFGISVTEDAEGAVQVQGAAYRLICANGAISRTCDSRSHRLRRPPNRIEYQSSFLRKVEAFARDGWKQWETTAKGVSELEKMVFNAHQRDALAVRLRQAPFFLSLGVIKRIRERLQTEIAGREGPPTLYDLYNAMTFLGTHEQTLSDTYRTRLRIGAGEFTRHESRICEACKQLVIECGEH